MSSSSSSSPSSSLFDEPPGAVVPGPGPGPPVPPVPPPPQSPTGQPPVQSPSPSTDSHVSFDWGNIPPEDQCMDYTPVFPGDLRQQDADALANPGWTQIPQNQRSAWSYVPYWSKPTWNPNIEISIDGTRQRVVRSGAEHAMRPTILPRDQNVPRTEYTKRWGINTTFPKTSDNQARSGLTPIAAAPDPDPADPEATRPWTHEESWQSYWFDGFTTQELINTGVYAPDTNVPMSDLPVSDLSSIFSRDRWTQPQEDPTPIVGKHRNVKLQYVLGGVTAQYNAELNDDIWEALQPSLRLASLVMHSNHPTWLMFLRGIYHMRKVPMALDGRTDREKIQENYRQYRTLYHEMDESEMYDCALGLYRRDFDAGVATAYILNKLVKWSFYEPSALANGSTVSDIIEPHTIFIYLNANNIWPLLVNEYSESEKVAMRVKLAMTIMHELGHACHQAHYAMMERPRETLEGMPGLDITRELVLLLLGLRREAVGMGARNDNGRQYFIENDVSMEEGKALDARLWGGLPDYFPPGAPNAQFRPMFQLRNWPFPHPEVYHQNAEAVRAGSYRNFTAQPYKTWLLLPRAPVYDLYTPIPVSNFSHLLQTSWWDGDFQKFGHDALKVSSNRDGQPYPMQSSINFRYNSFMSLIWPLVENRDVINFLFITAPKILAAQGHNLICAWLSKVSLDLAGAKIMKLRLHYERNTWDEKYGLIRDLSGRILDDFGEASDSLQDYLTSGDGGAGVVNLYGVQSQLDDLIRRDLVELHRLVDYEGRYAQSVAAEYFLKDLDDRQLVRRSMHILLGHLQATCDSVDAVMTAMTNIWPSMGQDAAFTPHVEEIESMYRRIEAARTAVMSVVQVLRGNTLDQRSGPGGHGPLAAVPAALRELKLGRNLRIAAMKEYSRIFDPRLKRVVQTWLNIIYYGQDIRHDDPSAEDVVVGGGTIAELKRRRDQATADAMAINYLDRQEQVQANRAAGMEPAEGEDRVVAEMQHEMEQLELTSGIIDLYGQSFSKEEQSRLRRRSI